MARNPTPVIPLPKPQHILGWRVFGKFWRVLWYMFRDFGFSWEVLWVFLVSYVGGSVHPVGRGGGLRGIMGIFGTFLVFLPYFGYFGTF